MVFGYATTPTSDSQDEIIDLEASFEAVDEWKQWANIKEMYGSQRADSLTQALLGMQMQQANALQQIGMSGMMGGVQQMRQPQPFNPADLLGGLRGAF